MCQVMWFCTLLYKTINHLWNSKPNQQVQAMCTHNTLVNLKVCVCVCVCVYVLVLSWYNYNLVYSMKHVLFWCNYFTIHMWPAASHDLTRWYHRQTAFDSQLDSPYWNRFAHVHIAFNSIVLMAVWNSLSVLDLTTLGELREAFHTKGLLLYRKYKKNNIELKQTISKFLFNNYYFYLCTYMSWWLS